MTPDELSSELLDAAFTDDPIAASLFGMPGYDDRLPDFSAAAQQDAHDRYASIAARAAQVSSDGLGESERQTLDFVLHTATVWRDAAEIPLVEWTIASFHAAPVTAALTLLPKATLDTDARADGYLKRLAALPGMLETAARRHADGIAAGRPAVARLVRSSIEMLDLMIAEPSVGGMKKGRGRPDSGFDAEVARLVEEAVRPALKSYRDDLEQTVLDVARDEAHCGICWLPGGDEMYRVLARLHTSTDRTPEDLHAAGIAIVEQVEAEFSAIGSRLWGTTDVREIVHRLLSDRDLRYASRDEMLEIARAAVARAEAEAPNWFGTVPDQKCLVEPVPAVEEAGSAAAYYLQGALDGSRRGTYYLNTSNPDERFRHLAEAVAFHEAVPGHHFQLTIAAEQTDLPLARRILADTACAEGWGLYAERLAEEMGLYRDDVARLGMLSTDAWRATRLVVDTGIHHLGWSRAEAVEWMAAHTALPSLEIDAEIDRYISYPGQALSYMVGRMEISSMRSRATERLGDGFDLRSFHDLVLKVGPLPLKALGGAVDRWIDASAT